MRKNVLEIPQHIAVPLHVHVQIRLRGQPAYLCRNLLQAPGRFTPKKRLAKTRVHALAVKLAELIVAAGGSQHGGNKVLVHDGGKGNLLERAELELVPEGDGRDVDVAAAGRISLGIKVHAHGFPEVAEDTGHVEACVQARGDDLHAD